MDAVPLKGPIDEKVTIYYEINFTITVEEVTPSHRYPENTLEYTTFTHNPSTECTVDGAASIYASNTDGLDTIVPIFYFNRKC